MYYQVVDIEPYAGGTIMRAESLIEAQEKAKEYLTKWPDAVIEIRKIEFIERWSCNVGWNPEKEEPYRQGA